MRNKLLAVLFYIFVAVGVFRLLGTGDPFALTVAITWPLSLSVWVALKLIIQVCLFFNYLWDFIL